MQNIVLLSTLHRPSDTGSDHANTKNNPAHPSESEKTYTDPNYSIAHLMTACLKPPLLWPATSTPKADVEAIKELGASLHGLYFNVEAWDAALQLYKFSKNPPDNLSSELARKWKFIAIHECVMQADYLRERLEYLPRRKGMNCLSVLTTMNKALFDNAITIFHKHFPEIKQLRHAVAHFGMIESQPEHHAPDGMFTIYRIEENDVFKAPYKGVVRQLAITDATSQNLSSVIAMIFEAFLPSAKELERLGHAD